MGPRHTSLFPVWRQTGVNGLWLHSCYTEQDLRTVLPSLVKALLYFHGSQRFNIINVPWYLLEPREPPGMAAVAALLGMDRTTLTAALKPLRRRGLLQIAADRSDRRGRIVVLTPKGRRLLVRAVPVWRSIHVELEALLPQGEPDHLRNNLRTIS